MSEWTKERQEELKDIANICVTNIFGHVRSRDLIDALDEIERLQSEVATLRSQQAELIEKGNYIAGCLRSYVGTLDDDWVILVKELTGGTDAHND